MTTNDEATKTSLTLTEKELALFRELLDLADGNGGDFGACDEIRLAEHGGQHAVAALLGSLQKKGAIALWENDAVEYSKNGKRLVTLADRMFDFNVVLWNADGSNGHAAACAWVESLDFPNGPDGGATEEEAPSCDQCGAVQGRLIEVACLGSGPTSDPILVCSPCSEEKTEAEDELALIDERREMRSRVHRGVARVETWELGPFLVDGSDYLIRFSKPASLQMGVAPDDERIVVLRSEDGCFFELSGREWETDSPLATETIAGIIDGKASLGEIEEFIREGLQLAEDLVCLQTHDLDDSDLLAAAERLLDRSLISDTPGCGLVHTEDCAALRAAIAKAKETR